MIPTLLETGASLGTILFFGVIIWLFYRYKAKTKKKYSREVAVPLKVDRTELLAQQRLQVSGRRAQMVQATSPTPIKKGDTQPTVPKQPVQAEPVDDGFGEDLGAALSLTQAKERSVPIRKSRFAALQDAADQFKDVYNRNNQL